MAHSHAHSLVNVEEVNTTRRKLEVEVPVESVKAEIDQAFQRVQHQAKIKGFRPGKAPRSVLEKYFGDQVRADVLSHLIEHTYSDAVREAGIRPVGPPEIVPEAIEPGKPLRFSAVVDVLPKIEIREAEGLPAKRARRAITEADVDRAIDRLRESLAELRPVEDREEAGANDFVVIDYTASLEGAPLPNAKKENRLVPIGGGVVPPELDRALPGMKLGETKTVDVPFPSDHPEAAVAGKTVQFEVTLRSIRQKVLPEADDALAKEHGECETLVELREKVKQRLAASFENEAMDRVRDQVIDQLVDRNPFEVPKSLVDRQVDALVEDLLDRFGERRGEMERDAARLDRLREETRPRADRQVRAVLALDTYAEQSGISISEEDVDNRLAELTRQAGDQAARVREIYREPAARADLRSRLARERALEQIVAAARIEDVDAESVESSSVVAPTEETR